MLGVINYVDSISICMQSPTTGDMVLLWEGCLKASARREKSERGREVNEVWQVLLAAEAKLNEPTIFPEAVPSLPKWHGLAVAGCTVSSDTHGDSVWT